MLKANQSVYIKVFYLRTCTILKTWSHWCLLSVSEFEYSVTLRNEVWSSVYTISTTTNWVPFLLTSDDTFTGRSYLPVRLLIMSGERSADAFQKLMFKQLLNCLKQRGSDLGAIGWYILKHHILLDLRIPRKNVCKFAPKLYRNINCLLHYFRHFFMNFARHIQKVTITEGISITVGHEVELFDPKMDTGH